MALQQAQQNILMRRHTAQILQRQFHRHVRFQGYELLRYKRVFFMRHNQFAAFVLFDFGGVFQHFFQRAERVDEFGGGFNVLSGETGAGKSIIVDSLMLIMGGKFDRTMLRYGEDACRVEAEFDTTEKAREYLREIDIDAEDITVISRKMTSDGKSESRINGRAVTLSAVRALGAMLLDICGQNEYQYLGLPAHHIDVLDAFARTESRPASCLPRGGKAGTHRMSPTPRF